MNKHHFYNVLILIIGFLSNPAFAGGVYQEPADFIKQVFDDSPPKPSVLWIKKDLKAELNAVLGHPYKGMRIRYWQQQDKTAWILDEKGKDKMITTGIVVNKGKIEQVKVLVFRESRGWEVRHDFFTDQFRQCTLVDDNRLDKHIDNISGATLSVRAVKKLARIALLLDRQVQQKNL